ncbi:MAG TPA: Gfo/Idh/MocA family oxidoreductase [Caulobacteraceae bacterium]|nr:Gfo/Idh/MocA family oxidoreductase [Caulobacteraceae bacterium]
MIRIGLLGASKIAPAAVIAPAAANPQFRVTAVAARDPARARAYAETHAIPGVAAGYAELVRRGDVDVVYNALPPAAHAEWTIAALEAGKAVLCEKPFAMDAAQARSMVDAAEVRGLMLLEAFHYRHHQVFRRAEALVKGGALGALRRARAEFRVTVARGPQELRWRADLGGGGLMDLGCYPVHALRTLVGTAPEIASATATFEGGVDVDLSASLVFAGGVEAQIACAMKAPAPAASLTLEGDRGRVEIINFLAPQLGCRFTTTLDGVTTVQPTDGPSTYAAQLADLAEVLAGRARPLTGGTDAIANMAAIEAIYAAAGRPAL